MSEETSRQRRRARQLQSILDAALELSEDGGLDGWSMRELATKVDFTPGALYRYFDSKSTLVAALADQSLAELHERLAAVEANRSPRERLEELGLAYLAFAAERPTEFRLTFLDLPGRRESLDEPPPTDSAYGVLLTAVVEAVAAGAIAASADFGPEQIAFTIWATVHGMAVLEATHLRHFEADFPTIHRIALAKLVAGLER